MYVSIKLCYFILKKRVTKKKGQLKNIHISHPSANYKTGGHRLNTWRGAGGDHRRILIKSNQTPLAAVYCYLRCRGSKTASFYAFWVMEPPAAWPSGWARDWAPRRRGVFWRPQSLVWTRACGSGPCWATLIWGPARAFQAYWRAWRWEMRGAFWWCFAA